ncbi:MAG TPA: DNA helicase, partial [Diaminobutyricibacter sp.]
MFILDGSVVTSASDLTEASKCEFAFLRKLDVKLGRIDKLDVPEDPMYVRTSRLGDEHEARVLARYKTDHGTGTVEIPRPDGPLTAENLEQAVATTRQAFADQAEVVFQATFFDGSFLGFADFIVRQPDGSYQVQDTKLARSARVTALLQLAAYAEQLEHLGVRVAPTVELLLGDGTISVHRLDDISPVYSKRRQRLLHIVQERLEDTQAVQWGDPRYAVCGHCDDCDAEIQASRDVLLVAGMRVTQRARLAAAGILTIDDLATTDLATVPGIADSTLASLTLQAQLQRDAHADEPPPVVVYEASALAVLPTPSPGDIFFDFEGDPLYTEGAGERWGLDYLFGSVDVQQDFTAFWAHDFAEEREALRAFLDWLGE